MMSKREIVDLLLSTNRCRDAECEGVGRLKMIREASSRERRPLDLAFQQYLADGLDLNPKEHWGQDILCIVRLKCVAR